MSDDDDYEDDPDDDELPAPLAIDLPAYNTAVCVLYMHYDHSMLMSNMFYSY
jgi:hypothetical protein